MTIAVDTRFLAEGRKEDTGSLDPGNLIHFVKKYHTHTFLFISDRPIKVKAAPAFPKNVIPLTAGPEIKNRLLMQYWFNYQLPLLMRKHKADVFLGMSGFCSLRTKVPQCILIPDTSFLQAPGYFSKKNARFYKKKMAAFLTKANAVGVMSEFSRSVLVNHYKENAGKIEVLHAHADEIFTPAGPEEKEDTKADYTDGKEYFLSPCTDHARSNLVNLLKAFSFFKKRQKSNMLLLITGDPGEDFMNGLKTYKFRNEVKILPGLNKEALARLTAGAYAMLYPVFYEDAAIPPLQAMQCGVPVISSRSGALPEICGNAALYINPYDFEDIAQQMMLVFKNEDKAREMIAGGMERTGHFQKEDSDALLWLLIQKAVNG